MSTVNTATDPAKLRQATLAAGIGNFITWFEFGSYGYLAVVLAQVFFPGEDPVIGLLATFATFAVAFLMNPIGGIVFGRLGDKIGRRTILATVITIMTLATFLIGVLPGYATIGVAAPALLVILRIVQGFAAGGEPGGAATFLVETAPPGKRAWTVSFWHSSSYLANASASLLILSMHALFTPEQMLAWGWRIPFLIILPLGLIALYIRMKLEDTAEFSRLEADGELSQSPVRDAFRTAWRPILITVGAITLQAAAFYFIFVYMETYLQSELGVLPIQASISTVTTLALAAVALFAASKVSDRIGRKPIMLIASVLLMVLPFPLFLLMGSSAFPIVLICHVLLGICLAIYMSGSGAGMLELFPSRVRYTGFSIGFNVSVALFGGTAPYLATWLISATGSPLSPAVIVIGTALIATVSIALARWPVGPREPLDRADVEASLASCEAPVGTARTADLPAPRAEAPTP